MVGITGREIAIYLGNRIFVRGFISGKRVLQVKEGDHERDKDKHAKRSLNKANIEFLRSY